jgi:hypothetical protein
VVRSAALTIIPVILCLEEKEKQIMRLHTISWFFVVIILATCFDPGVDQGFLGHKAYTIFGAVFKKKNTKLRTKNRYKSEYLFRALGGARASEGHCSFLSFKVNPPVSILWIIFMEECQL